MRSAGEVQRPVPPFPRSDKNPLDDPKYGEHNVNMEPKPLFMRHGGGEDEGV